MGVFLANLAEIGRDFLQQFEIETCIAFLAFQRRDHGLGGAVAVGHAHRGNGGIDIVDAGLGRLHDRGGAQAGGRVTLHVNRHLDRRLQPRDQFEGHIGLEQAGHVLDGNGMRAHVLEPLGQVHPHVDGVDGADGIGNGALGMLAVGNGCLNGALEIARVIEGVEDTEDIDAIDGAALDELLDHIVGVMTITEQVLPAQQHLQRGLGQGFLEFAQPVPGILAQITDAGVEGGAAPAFQRPEANLVELAADRQHVVDAQTRRQQGLVRVAQHYIGDPQGFSHSRFLIEYRVFRVDCRAGLAAVRTLSVSQGHGDGRDKFRLIGLDRQARSADLFPRRIDVLDQPGGHADDPDQQGQKQENDTHADEHQLEARDQEFGEGRFHIGSGRWFMALTRRAGRR